LTLEGRTDVCEWFCSVVNDPVAAAAATVTVLDVRATIEPWSPVDLAVDALVLNPEKARAGEPVNVSVQVENHGPNGSPATTLAWRHEHDGGTEEAAASVPALSAGENVTLEWTIVAAAGENTVTATIDPDAETQDADGSNNEATARFEPASEPEPPEAGFELKATGYKEQGLQKADLSWTNATGASIDVVRDDVVVATTENDGNFTDHIDNRGQGSYVYRVCEAGTATCSNEVVLEF
jgi:hypothetical protein